jgi:hypothetical protein
MRIYKSTHETIYVGNTDITVITDEHGDFFLLKISSIEMENESLYMIDNIFYLQDLKQNKSEIKKELKEKNLWEKGIFKAIKILLKIEKNIFIPEYFGEIKINSDLRK